MLGLAVGLWGVFQHIACSMVFGKRKQEAAINALCCAQKLNGEKEM